MKPEKNKPGLMKCCGQVIAFTVELEKAESMLIGTARNVAIMPLMDGHQMPKRRFMQICSIPILNRRT